MSSPADSICLRQRLLETRPKSAPDFRVQRFDKVAYVEAVTTGRPAGSKLDEDVMAALRRARPKCARNSMMRFRSGSAAPCIRNFRKEYWQLHDVSQWALVIAIA